VISVHGTADPVVLYNGGLGAGQTIPIPPVKQTIAGLAKRNGCTAAPVNETPAAHVERLRYVQCTHGRSVELLSIIGGGHPWPRGLQATHTPPIATYSASAAILDFFAAQSR